MDMRDPSVYLSEQMQEESKEFFIAVYKQLVVEFDITATDELIGLERVIKAYIRLRKAEDKVELEGDTVVKVDSNGNEYQVVHPLMPWINVWDNQLRSWMTSMRFTRKEKKGTTVKKQDLAKELEKLWKKGQKSKS
jgi:hypothetical protein